MPLISVIVPVYKVEEYLDDCVRSLMKQTLADIEIILVDDGSPDNCREMCDTYAKEDARVLVVHKENQGLGFARNSGLAIAQGKYVAFVDSDDFVDRDRFERLYRVISENNADTCLESMANYYRGKKLYRQKPFQKTVFENDEIRRKLVPALIGANGKGEDYIGMSVCRGLYSNDLIQSHNLRFPSEREWVSEDLIFDFDYYVFSKRAVLSDGCGYYYRINDESLTHQPNIDKRKQYAALYRKLLEKTDPQLRSLYCPRIQYSYIFNIKALVQSICRKSSWAECRSAVETILSDETFVNVISEFPLSTLTYKKRILLGAMKNKNAFMVYYLLKLQLMLEKR